MILIHDKTGENSDRSLAFWRDGNLCYCSHRSLRMHDIQWSALDCIGNRYLKKLKTIRSSNGTAV